MMPDKDYSEQVADSMGIPVGEETKKDESPRLSDQYLRQLFQEIQNPSSMPPKPAPMSIPEALALATMGTMYKSDLSRDLLHSYVIPELQWRESYPERLAEAERQAHRTRIQDLALGHDLALRNEDLKRQHEQAAHLLSSLPARSRAVRDIIQSESFKDLPPENRQALESDLAAYDALVDQVRVIVHRGEVPDQLLMQQVSAMANGLDSGRDELLRMRNELFISQRTAEAQAGIKSQEKFEETSQQIDRANLLTTRLGEYSTPAEQMAESIREDDPDMADYLLSSLRQATASAELIADQGAESVADPVIDEYAKSVDKLDAAIRATAHRRAELDRAKTRAAQKRQLPGMLFSEISDQAAGLMNVRELRDAFEAAEDPGDLVGFFSTKTEQGKKFLATYQRVKAPIKHALLGAAQTATEKEDNIAWLIEPDALFQWRPEQNMRNSIDNMEQITSNKLLSLLTMAHAGGYDVSGMIRESFNKFPESYRQYLLDFAARNGLTLLDEAPPPGIGTIFDYQGRDTFYDPVTGEVFVRESP